MRLEELFTEVENILFYYNNQSFARLFKYNFNVSVNITDHPECNAIDVVIYSNVIDVLDDLGDI